MSEKLYEVKGKFTILYPSGKWCKTKTDKRFTAMEDIIKIALEDSHIRVRNVRVVNLIPPSVVRLLTEEERDGI